MTKRANHLPAGKILARCIDCGGVAVAKGDGTPVILEHMVGCTSTDIAESEGVKEECGKCGNTGYVRVNHSRFGFGGYKCDCAPEHEQTSDHLLHLVLTWADAGQLHSGGTWRDRAIYRRGAALSLAAQLAACTMNARGMIGPNLHITDVGSDLLTEWDALVAGEPEPAPPVAKRGPELTAYQRMTGTGDGVDPVPSCLDDLEG